MSFYFFTSGGDKESRGSTPGSNQSSANRGGQTPARQHGSVYHTANSRGATPPNQQCSFSHGDTWGKKSSLEEKKGKSN